MWTEAYTEKTQAQDGDLELHNPDEEFHDKAEKYRDQFIELEMLTLVCMTQTSTTRVLFFIYIYKTYSRLLS